MHTLVGHRHIHGKINYLLPRAARCNCIPCTLLCIDPGGIPQGAPLLCIPYYAVPAFAKDSTGAGFRLPNKLASFFYSMAGFVRLCIHWVMLNRTKQCPSLAYVCSVYTSA